MKYKFIAGDNNERWDMNRELNIFLVRFGNQFFCKQTLNQNKKCVIKV